MLSLVTYENLDRFGKIFQGQFKLRHEGFLQRQDYNVRQYRAMEYDQYDTPASSYLIYHKQDAVLGVNRLTPTTHSCMLKDLSPELVDDKSLLDDPLVWEGTRYCISKDVAPDQRKKIIHEMAVAYLEFGLSMGLKKIIGMMPTYIIRSVFEKPGIKMESLGKTAMIGRHKVKAVAIPVEQKQLENVRKTTGVDYAVLVDLYNGKESETDYARAA